METVTIDQAIRAKAREQFARELDAAFTPINELLFYDRSKTVENVLSNARTVNYGMLLDKVRQAIIERHQARREQKAVDDFLSQFREFSEQLESLQSNG